MGFFFFIKDIIYFKEVWDRLDDWVVFLVFIGLGFIIFNGIRVFIKFSFMDRFLKFEDFF